MISNNVIGDISGSLLALIQHLEGKAVAYREFESGDLDVIEGVMSSFADARLLIEELRMAEESIATNQNLSVTGQQDAMAKVVKDILTRAKFIEKKANDRRNACESERAAAFAIPKAAGGDATVNFTKEQEHRARLRTMSLAERMRVYYDAVQRNEPSLVRAVKDPAFSYDLLAEGPFADYVRRVDREHLEHGQPERWARLQTLEKSAQWLQLMSSAIEMQLSGYGQVPSFQGQPIGKTDLGLQNPQQAPKKKDAIDMPPTHTPAFV
ncbi:MAG: hypothetical protein CV088_17545 [Nitrospira sp. LK70]|nr:hypothetical protein [Nitrospira sp. LK70]